MTDGAWMLALAWSATLLFLTPVLLRGLGLLRPNFRQEIIPTAYGLYPMLWLIPVYWLCGLGSLNPRIAYAHVLAAAGYGILGMVDDKWGCREFRGIKGHVLALLQHQRITTGLIKAVGGISLGFAVAFNAGFRDILNFIICGLIIALTANAFNLLDLRPGRACAVFLMAAVLTIICAPVRSAGLMLTLIPACIVYLQDARAKVMLGDTGSNLLGGLLGLGLVLAVDSMIGRLTILTVLIALHLLAEKVSITQLIERNPVLRRLDALTGVR